MMEIAVFWLKQGAQSSDQLLRSAASRFTGLAPAEFETVREFGKKPYFLRHPELSASVSHSGGIWAVALTPDGPVGLDIQLPIRSPRRDAIARRYFHPKEAEATLSSHDPDAAFSRIWCRKEAAAKLSGRGIDGAFGTFDVTSPDPVTVFGEPLYLADFSLPADSGPLHACLAFQKPCSPRMVPLIVESELS